MAASHRQQLRPTLEDLPDPESEDDNDEPVYAPAASRSFAKPPTIGKASASANRSDKRSRHGRREPLMRELKQAEDRERERGKVHFNLDLNGHSGEGNGPYQNSPDSDGITGSSSLIGTIQERSSPASHAGGQRRSESSGQSRFAALRKLDKDVASGKDGQAPFKSVAASSQHSAPFIETHYRTKLQEDDGEIWLDEDGEPMSAFRRNRLLKQGIRPPGVKKAKGALASSEKVDAASSKNRNALTPEVAKEPTSLSALISSISAENDAQIAAMDQDQVQRDLQDVREALGDRFLQLLAAKTEQDRRKATEKEPRKESRAETAASPSNAEGKRPADQQGTPHDIRKRYFQDQPSTLPTSLQWMEEDAKSTDANEIRFDFDGKLIEHASSEELRTRLSGLHHHGDDQEKPGYSIGELLHLARSTAPGQRVIALQTLSRIVEMYPEYSTSTSDVISKKLKSYNVRARGSVVASWYLEERQLNVRFAALACIRSCISTSAAFDPSCSLIEQRRSRDGQASAPSTSDAAVKLLQIEAQEFADQLCRLLSTAISLPDLNSADMECILDILFHLSSRSRITCTRLTEDARILGRLSDLAIKKRQWPPLSARQAPPPSYLRLLNILISSSRQNAALVCKLQLVQDLSRFLTIDPASLPEEMQDLAYNLSSRTLQIYGSMARYGMGADEYGRQFPIFAGVLDMLRNVSVVSDSNRGAITEATEAALALFANWTVCATDPHGTTHAHDITWSQVSEWGDLGLDILGKVTTLCNEDLNTDLVMVMAEATRFIDVWLRGAVHNSDIRARDVLQALESTLLLRQVVQILRKVCASLQGDKIPLVSKIERLAAASRLGQSLASLCIFAANDVSDCEIEQGDLRESADRLRETLHLLQRSGVVNADLIDRSMRFVAAFASLSMQLPLALPSPSASWLGLLLDLRRGDEKIAKDIIDTYAIRDDRAKRDLQIVSPFVFENIRPSTDPQVAPLSPSVESLPVAQTLFLICEKPSKSVETSDEIGGDGQTQGEDEDTDPMTGNVLWKSHAAGLPLRRDWSLSALDDLLHSGNCAALNRRNALPENWDANEADIVRASLSLTVWICEATSTSPLIFQRAAPSSAELHMGIVKVLLLEEEQATNTKATGIVTGRDLFRKPEIGSLLRQIFSLARERPQKTDAQPDDLEKVTLRQMGPTLPFFQTYTDLVSVYDAVSFGDELFGRALLLPLTMHYAADYRRCLWIEHAHCLPSIATTIADAPAPLSSYLVGPVETDEGLIEAYLSALLGGKILVRRNELLHTIATNHLAKILWTGGPTSVANLASKPSMAHRIARAVFGRQQAEFQPQRLSDVREALMNSQIPHETERKAREEIVATLVN